MKTPSVIVFAYACEPGSGSEPGAGWLWVRLLARMARVRVITRANNRAAIEAALPSLPEAGSLTFSFVDPPRWLTFWKRGQRGVRLFYLLWQRWATRVARRMLAQEPADYAWHLTLANVWLGSGAARLGLPLVLGPVGGGISPPLALIPSLGLRGIAYEGLRWLARLLSRFVNPLARLSWRRASLILVQNEDTLRWLPSRHRPRAVVFPNVLLESGSAISSPRHESNARALFAGRLLPLKGAHLAIEAIASLPEWSLLVCGEGPEAKRLFRLATRHGAQERIRFTGQIPRERLHHLMRNEADVFVFPSLHDEAPWVVAEAMSCGLPVVCLDVGGPPTIAAEAGVCVLPRRGTDVIEGLRRALAAPLPPASRALARAEEFTMERRREELSRVLHDAGLGFLTRQRT